MDEDIKNRPKHIAPDDSKLTNQLKRSYSIRF